MVPSFLKAPNGVWTESCEESLNLLLDTHFPGSSTNVINLNEEHIVNNIINDDLITKEKIEWAIKSFDSYKSPGPDGITPAELQMSLDIILPALENILLSCISMSYIPKAWREVKVVFIPKAGKCSHTNPKDLRPISLSSFLLKTFERLIDLKLRSDIDPNQLSSSQHAYCKGKSVETALHSLVQTIEKSLCIIPSSLEPCCKYATCEPGT